MGKAKIVPAFLQCDAIIASHYSSRSAPSWCVGRLMHQGASPCRHRIAGLLQTGALRRLICNKLPMTDDICVSMYTSVVLP
jgi:hypothetical protein